MRDGSGPGHRDRAVEGVDAPRAPPRGGLRARSRSRSTYPNIAINGYGDDPRPIYGCARPARRREPPAALRAPARARAVRDRSGARDRHRPVAGLDPPRPPARGGVRARPAAGPAVVLRARDGRLPPAVRACSTRRPARAIRRSRATRSASRSSRPSGAAACPSRSPTSSERDYSPGRTWQSLAVGIAALLKLGDVLDVGSGDGAAAATLAPYCRSLTCIDTNAAPDRGRAGAAARQHGNVRAQVADVHALPFQDAVVRRGARLPHADLRRAPGARARGVRARAAARRAARVLCLDEHQQSRGHRPLRRAPPGLLAARPPRACSRAPGSPSSRRRSPSRETKKPHLQVVLAIADKPSRPPRRRLDEPRPRTTNHPLAKLLSRAHRHHRRRDGHDHPHLRHEGGRHPRRALQGREEGSAQQRRPLLAHAAEDDLRHPPALPRGRRRHHRDQHLRRDQHRAERVLRRRSARARRPQGSGLLPEDHRGPVPRRAWPGRSTSSRRGSAASGPTASPTPTASSASWPAPSGRSRCRSRTRPTPTTPGFRVVTFDQVKAAYVEQVRALIAGGSDVLLVETIFDSLNAKAALVAIQEVFEQDGKRLPIMISAAVGRGGETMISAQTVEALWNAVEHVKPLVGRAQLLARPGPDVSVPLRARGEVERGDLLLPERRAAEPALADGLRSRAGRHGRASSASSRDAGLVNIAGGCCGNTPEHIAAIAKALDGSPAARASRVATPRRLPIAGRARAPRPLRLSGSQPFTQQLGVYMMIGERTNVAGSPKFAKLDQGGQVRGGGQRRAPAGRERRQRHRHLHGRGDDRRRRGDDALPARCSRSEPEVAKVPFMVDSSKWEVIEAGLKCLQGKGIVNSISLKEGEEKFRQNARTVLQYGAAVVVMAFDEQGQAATLRRQDPHLRARLPHPGRRGRASRPRTSSSIPNILTVATGIEEHNNYAVDFIEATRWIKANLPHAKVSGGVSQHLVQLPRQQPRARGDALGVPLPRHPRRHGHGHRQRRHARGLRGDRARAARARRGRAAQPPPRRDRAARRLRREAEGARRRRGRRPRRRTRSGAAAPVEERLSHALVKGIDTYIDADTEEARAKLGRPLVGHRRAADGRHERRRRSVRRGQDVPAAGGEVGARDEEGRRLPDAVHGGREGGDGRRRARS